MKKILSLNVLILISIITCICACTLTAQEKPNNKTTSKNEAFVIREVQPDKRETTPAPAESLQAFREFFGYIQKPKPDIGSDEKARQKWLSQNMRAAVADKAERTKKNLAENPDDKPDFPDNGSFIGAWDYPTTFSVIGSRQHDDRVIVDVLYTWGEGTNYAGDKRLMSFCLIKEDGTWKVDDIYSFRGEYIVAESLTQSLRGN